MKWTYVVGLIVVVVAVLWVVSYIPTYPAPTSTTGA